MAACTLPAGAVARRHGRRAAFLAGTGCGVLVGLLAGAGLVAGGLAVLLAAITDLLILAAQRVIIPWRRTVPA